VITTWRRVGIRREPIPSGETIPDDTDLVSLAQLNPARFAALCERYLDTVFGNAYRRLGDRDAASDATARTFAQALAALPSYRPRHARAFQS
jgi:DNA-directed RNA polymerase specialized sigma24 family protein